MTDEDRLITNCPDCGELNTSYNAWRTIVLSTGEVIDDERTFSCSRCDTSWDAVSGHASKTSSRDS